MIKSILLLLCLTTTAFGQFPYHTNSASFNALTNATGDYDAFSWSWMGYDDQRINVNLQPPGYSNVMMRMAYPRRGTVFLDVTDGVLNVTNFTASITRSNLPPDGIYFCEFLGYVGSFTSMPARVLATGKVNIQHSLFQNTTQSTWTNPLAGTVIGPPFHTLSSLTNWPFLIGSTASFLTTNSPDGVTIIYNTNGTISAVAAGVAWGAITGTLTNQTDLNDALNGKYPNSNPSNYCTIFAATNGLSGYVSTNDLRVINSTTNVSGGYLTWANNVISLTHAAISNAMAGVYQLAGNYWSKGDAVTNATDSVAVHTNDESYLASLTNFTVSGPASVTRTGRNVALVVSNQTPDMGGYVATGAVGTAAYASSNQFATSNQGAKADGAVLTNESRKVSIGAANTQTNTFGGALVIGGARYQANGGQVTANGGWGNFGGSAFGMGSWANYSATASGDGSWATYSSSASGDGSWAGAASIASGLHSWSFGQGATASNDYSFAWAGSHSHGSYTFNIGTPDLFYLGNTNLQTFLNEKMNSNGVTSIIYSNPASFQAAGNYLTNETTTLATAAGRGGFAGTEVISPDSILISQPDQFFPFTINGPAIATRLLLGLDANAGYLPALVSESNNVPTFWRFRNFGDTYLCVASTNELGGYVPTSGVTSIIYSNPAAFQAAGNYTTPATSTQIAQAVVSASGALTNIPTAATNLPAGQLVYQGGTLYSGTNDQAGARGVTNIAVNGTTGTVSGGIASVTITAGGGGNIYTNFSALPAAGTRGTVVYFTDSPYVAVDNGVSYDYYFDGELVYPPSTNGWTVAQAYSLSLSGGYLTVSGTNTTPLITVLTNIPAFPFTVTACIGYPTDSPVYAGAGLTWSDGTKLGPSYYNYDTSDPSPYYNVKPQKWSNTSTFSASYAATFPCRATDKFWIQLRDDGTNRATYFSTKNSNYVLVHTVSRTDYLTPTLCGFVHRPYSATTAHPQVSYLYSIRITSP